MTIFLTVLFIVLIIGSIVVGYFAEAVPFLGTLSIPLIIITVIIGIVWAVFVGIEIYNKLKGKK